jgi:potassium voltage-gated channel Eag-related subfamily H protein 7
VCARAQSPRAGAAPPGGAWGPDTEAPDTPTTPGQSRRITVRRFSESQSQPNANGNDGDDHDAVFCAITAATTSGEDGAGDTEGSSVRGRGGSPRARLSSASGTSSFKARAAASRAAAAAAAAEASAAARRRVREPSALILPSSAFMRRWDVVTLVLLAYTATVTPFGVCFLDPSTSITDGLFWVDRAVDLLFAFDVFINFNLAYHDADSQRLITGRATVALNYAKGSAILDIVSTIPFDVIGQQAGAAGASNLKVLRILRIFRLFKLLRVLRSSRVLLRLQDSMNVSYGYLTLAKFAAACILIAHWMACLFHLVQASQSSGDGADGECNWVSHYFSGLRTHDGVMSCELPADAIPVASRYLTALYWSVMTISTVGYGDVPPQTDAERAFEILGMLLGASTYAYVVGSVCGVAATLSERETEHERVMDRLNSFISEASLPEPLANRLRAFFRYAHTAARHADWTALLGRMSPGLRGATALAVHGPWLARVPLLAACPAAMQVELAFAFAPVVLPPGEALLHANGRADKLIVLQKGLVLTVRACALRRILSTHDVVGEQLLWSNRRVCSAALSLTFVEAHALSRERLLAILDLFPSFRRRVRAATIVDVLTETLKQMRAAAAGVRAAEVLARMRGRAAPAWCELLDACQPPGCSRFVESYCQLTPALTLMVIQAAAPRSWGVFQRAAGALQRAFRKQLAARREEEARAEAEAKAAEADAKAWRAASALPRRERDAAAAAARAASTSPLPPQGATAASQDVASAVLAALAPQLRELAAAQAALSADVARLRAEALPSDATAVGLVSGVGVVRERARVFAAAAAEETGASPPAAAPPAPLQRVGSWGAASPPG